MSAPDKAPPETVHVVCYDGLPGSLGNVAYPDLRHTIETYRHDRVLASVKAERDDLRKRLGKLVKAATSGLERLRFIGAPGMHYKGCACAECQLESAIAAAKGEKHG